jgi:mevalonate kinase
MPLSLKGISKCIEMVLEWIKPPKIEIAITIESKIPMGRGLGSSAAVALAVVRSLYLYFDYSINETELFHLVQIAEDHAHGNASGIDMVAAAGDTPIWYERHLGMRRIHVENPFFYVIADSGIVGNTAQAVKKVNQLYEHSKVHTQR